MILGLIETLPETAVVAFSASYGDVGVALGTALGGNVFLFTLGIASVGLAYVTRYGGVMNISAEYRVENRYLLFSTAALVALLIYGKLDLYSGAALIAIYLAYVIERTRQPSSSEGRPARPYPVLLLSAGFLLAIVSSEPFAVAINDVSTELGVPPLLLSLVVAPLATDVDALLTSVMLVRKRKEGGSLAVIGVVGSKIENATILLGVVGLLSPLSLQGYLLDLAFFVLSNAVAIYVLYDRTLGLKESLVLVMMYFISISVLYLFSL
jgi:Ca2+/Na+ antiporter